VTEAELQRMLGSGRVCRFASAPDEAPVAAATAPDAGATRGVIKLHGRLVMMTVRYPASASDGFELASEDVRVTAKPHESQTDGEARDGEAVLQIGRDLEVGYGGFYSCAL
jgi:hypothetical protein